MIIFIIEITICIYLLLKGFGKTLSNEELVKRHFLNFYNGQFIASEESKYENQEKTSKSSLSKGSISDLLSLLKISTQIPKKPFPQIHLSKNLLIKFQKIFLY